MLQNFAPGDFLVFQIESGFVLLRMLGVDSAGGEIVWHVAAYETFYLDVDSAETALENAEDLPVAIAHVALSNRAFESTQVARIASRPLTEAEVGPLDRWIGDPQREISDRSIRLMLGLR